VSIANELSSEVAVWLLAHRTPTNITDAPNSTDIQRVILELHATFQSLKAGERVARRLAMHHSSARIKSATANNH
jgi:hypothetical protein